MASSDDKKEDGSPIRSEAVVEAYRRRLQVLRKAQEFSRADEIPKAVQQYNLYLNSLARFFDIKEEELTPKNFDKERDITELLLISQVYWDLAKAYDRSPKLSGEALRCLNQFAKFTIGFKYQYVNAQMLKKYIRGRLPHNVKIFEMTYDKIRVEGKGCYIASCLYGPSDARTNVLRHFRDQKLSRITWGRAFIDQYENYSPILVDLHMRSFFVRPLTYFIVKPVIDLIVYLIGRSHDRP